MRRLFLLGAVALFLSYALGWFVVFAAPVDAVSQTTVPWTTDLPSGSSSNDWGECNQVFIPFVPGSSGSNLSYYVQLACQFMVPVSGGLQPMIVDPALPSTHTSIDTSGTYVVSTGPAEWESPSAAIGVYSGFGIEAGNSCDPTAGTVAGPMVFSGAETGGSIWCSSDTAAGINQNPPSGFPGSTSGGDQSQTSTGEVTGFTVGPSEVASDGHSYTADAMTATWVENNAQICSGCGGANPFDPVLPDSPLGSSGSCPSSSTLISQTDDRKWDGTDLTGTNQMWLQFSGGTDPSYYGGTGILEVPLHMDSFTCYAGEPFVNHAAVPSNYFSGGAPGGAIPQTCSLTEVSGVAGNTSYVSGDSYAVTFTYTGSVSELVVDPSDGAAVTLSIGTSPGGGTPWDVGTDSSVVSATGSPQTVTFQPTASGDWDPTFYCVGGSPPGVYPWGNADDAVNECLDGVCVTQGNPTGGGASDLAACFAAANFDLYSPASWVVGGLHDGLCILEWLFVPSSSTVASLTGLFAITSDGGGGGSATAGQWLGALTAFAAAAPSGAISEISSAASGGCDVGPVLPFDGNDLTLCGSLAAAQSSSSWSVIDSMVSACFLVMMALAMFHLVRRVVTGSSA